MKVVFNINNNYNNKEYKNLKFKIKSYEDILKHDNTPKAYFNYLNSCVKKAKNLTIYSFYNSLLNINKIIKQHTVEVVIHNGDLFIIHRYQDSKIFKIFISSNDFSDDVPNDSPSNHIYNEENTSKQKDLEEDNNDENNEDEEKPSFDDINKKVKTSLDEFASPILTTPHKEIIKAYKKRELSKSERKIVTEATKAKKKNPKRYPLTDFVSGNQFDVLWHSDKKISIFFHELEYIKKKSVQYEKKLKKPIEQFNKGKGYGYLTSLHTLRKDLISSHKTFKYASVFVDTKFEEIYIIDLKKDIIYDKIKFFFTPVNKKGKILKKEIPYKLAIKD